MQKGAELYRGKAKTVYATDDPRYLIMHYRDDVSAFDGAKLAKLERKGEHSLKSVEIKLLVPGNSLIASQEGFSFEEGVDLVTDSLKRQIKTYKEKLRA